MTLKVAVLAAFAPVTPVYPAPQNNLNLPADIQKQVDSGNLSCSERNDGAVVCQDGLGGTQVVVRAWRLAYHFFFQISKYIKDNETNFAGKPPTHPTERLRQRSFDIAAALGFNHGADQQRQDDLRTMQGFQRGDPVPINLLPGDIAQSVENGKFSCIFNAGLNAVCQDGLVGVQTVVSALFHTSVLLPVGKLDEILDTDEIPPDP